MNFSTVLKSAFMCSAPTGMMVPSSECVAALSATLSRKTANFLERDTCAAMLRLTRVDSLTPSLRPEAAANAGRRVDRSCKMLAFNADSKSNTAVGMALMMSKRLREPRMNSSPVEVTLGSNLAAVESIKLAAFRKSRRTSEIKST